MNRQLSIQPCTNNSIICQKRFPFPFISNGSRNIIMFCSIRMRTFLFANANECGSQLVFAAKTKPEFQCKHNGRKQLLNVHKKEQNSLSLLLYRTLLAYVIQKREYLDTYNHSNQREITYAGTQPTLMQFAHKNVSEVTISCRSKNLLHRPLQVPFTHTCHQQGMQLHPGQLFYKTNSFNTATHAHLQSNEKH